MEDDIEQTNRPNNEICFAVVQDNDGGITAWVTGLEDFLSSGCCDDCFQGPDLPKWGQAQEACLEWYGKGTAEDAFKELLGHGLVYNQSFVDFIHHDSAKGHETVYRPESHNDPMLFALATEGQGDEVEIFAFFVRKSYWDQHHHLDDQERKLAWWHSWADEMEAMASWTPWKKKNKHNLSAAFIDMEENSCVFSEELAKFLEQGSEDMLFPRMID